MSGVTIDKLQIEIEAKAKKNSDGLDKLSNSLAKLRNDLSGGMAGLDQIASSLGNLSVSINNLKGRTGTLSSLANTMEKLSSVNLGGLQGNLAGLSDSAAQLNSIGDSLQSIRDFGKGINSIIKSVEKIKILDLTGVVEKVKTLVNALKPLTDEMVRAGTGAVNYGEQLKYLAQAAKVADSNQRKLNTATASVAKSMTFGINLTKFTAAYYVMRRIMGAIAGFVTNINTYIENMNLYYVAMGKFASQGRRLAETMEIKIGIDSGEAMRNMGLFMQLTTSFGVMEEQAYTLSKNLTQLGYDISSFFNISISESFLKLQSGIAGEIEPLRRIGIDISAARMQMELFELGIDANVNSLSQADKSLLRYIAILKQTGNAQGDMAATVMQPANAIRILQAQVSLAGRAIGSIFIPMLMAILPPAIAVVKIIRGLADTIAGIFGFQMPEFRGREDDLGNISAGVDGIGDSAKAAKKEMNALIGGFDELNIFNKSTGAKGEDDVTKNILAGIKLPEYDMFKGLVENDVEKWVDLLKPKLESLLKIVGLIGVGFASWKIANGIYDFFHGDSVGLTLGGIKKIWDIFNSPSGQVVKLTSMFGGWTAYLSPAAVKILTIAGTAGTIAIIVARFADLYANSEKFRKGLERIGEIGKGVFGGMKDMATAAGEAIMKIIPEPVKRHIEGTLERIREIIGGLDLDFKDLLFTLGGIGLLFTPAAPFGVALLTFEAVSVAIRGLGDAATESIEVIDLFADGISETTKSKLEPFLKEIDVFDQRLKNIKWIDKIIEQSDVEDIKKQANSISQAIINELDADKNESLKKLNPLKNILSPDKYSEIANANSNHYEMLGRSVLEGEKQINEIVQRASSEKRALTADEYSKISKIQENMKNTGVKYLSDSETEMNLIMQRLKNNQVSLSSKQASEIVKNSLTAKNKTIDYAKTQYDDISFEAQKMLDVGAINKEQYDEIIKSAGLAKDETILSAEKQHERIVKESQLQAGELVNNVDWTTGEIKSKWDVFWDETNRQFEEGWDDLTRGIKTWWEDDVSPWFTKEKWQELGANIKKGIETEWNKFEEWWSKTAIVKWWNEDVSPWFTLEKWKELFMSIPNGFREIKEDVKTAAKEIWKAAWDIISKPIDLTINIIKKITETVSSAFSGGGGSSVPAMASGGVVRSPRIVQVGEYPGASSNPEIITPQNIMYDTVVEANEGLITAFLTAADRIVEAINDKDTTTYLDGEVLYASNQKVGRNRGVNFNMGSFAR